MKGVIARVLSFIMQLVLSGFVFVAIHEEYHFLVASWLHVPGYVTFAFPLGGTFWFSNLSAVTLNQNVLISMAGGFGTGVCAGILWLTSDMQDSTHWAAIFCVVTVTQLLYGASELLAVWLPHATEWGQVAAAIVGYGTAILIYGDRVLDWWIGETRAQTNEHRLSKLDKSSTEPVLY
jgi:hypothetical protein